MTDLVLWLHIVAAGVWIGTSVVQLMAPPLLADGGPLVKATWGKAVLGFGRRITTPAAVLLLITGIELVRSGGYSYTDAFVLIGIVVVLVGGAIGGAVVGPTSRQLTISAEAGEESGVQEAEMRLRTFGVLDLALVLFTVYTMVTALGA